MQVTFTKSATKKRKHGNNWKEAAHSPLNNDENMRESTAEERNKHTLIFTLCFRQQVTSKSGNLWPSANYNQNAKCAVKNTKTAAAQLCFAGNLPEDMTSSTTSELPGLCRPRCSLSTSLSIADMALSTDASCPAGTLNSDR